MGIERVVEEGGALDDLVVVAGDLGEPLADRPQPRRLGRAVDLLREVRPVDDAGERLERRVAGEPLVDQLLERAPAPLVAVGVARAGGVEALGAVALLWIGHQAQ